MAIRDEPKENYRFHNPLDTCNILYSEISKKGRWEYNEKRKREEKKDWWYESRNDFEKNITLIFSSFIPYSLISDEQNENKDKYLQFVVKEFNIFKDREYFNSQKTLDILKSRRAKLIESLKSSGFHLKEFHATCQWRLIIGLGASHPQETSMTLHHTYGIPYIPGSAIKGATRYCAVLKFAEKDKKDDEGWEEAIERISRSLEEGTVLGISLDSLKFKNLIDIFGTQNQHGEVIFMDAYPLNEVNLKIDIMNPHYQNYYSGKEPPADWQNPNPIKFLTVEKTKFQFNLLSKDEDLLVKSEALLKSALKELGIGAKTAIGYGIFNIY